MKKARKCASATLVSILTISNVTQNVPDREVVIMRRATAVLPVGVVNTARSLVVLVKQAHLVLAAVTMDHVWTISARLGRANATPFGMAMVAMSLFV